MDASEELRITYAITELRRIQHAIANHAVDWTQHTAAARSVISSVNSTSLMQQPDRAGDQQFIISGLQKLAYYEPDSGGVQDIAEWCVTQWLRLLQHNGENVDALEGLGLAWLSRAQAALGRIHREEGSPSSGNSSGRPGTAGSQSYTSSDDARDAARTAAEADARLHTADYVEARGILLPSTEYFSRAVNVADRHGVLSGPLLALAAESYMSLGNVSYSYVNEQYFRQALMYLQRASEIPGYALSPYLRSYLDDYGRLIS